MRSLTSHKVNGLNDELVVSVLDKPGLGGACHKYRIASLDVLVDIEFQDGPISEAGVNGISQEALLAIVEDRLIGFSVRSVFLPRELDRPDEDPGSHAVASETHPRPDGSRRRGNARSLTKSVAVGL